MDKIPVFHRFVRLVWCAAALLTLPAEAADLSLYTEETAPLSMMRNGAVRGLATDVLRAALAKAGISYDITVFPRRRAFDQALTRDNGCVYPLNRTAEREAQFRWVGPLAKGGWGLFAIAGHHIVLPTLDDAKAYRIGVSEGDAISLYLKEHGLFPIEVSAANADEINIRKLDGDRIDLWATGTFKAPYVAAQYGKTLHLALQFKDVAVFMGCNRRVPEAATVKLNGIIWRLWENGSVDEFSRAYR